MRVVRVAKLSGWLVLACVVCGAAFFVLGTLARAQVVATLLRFRPVQVIEEFVIDLEDADLDIEPRYNTFALADLDEDGTPDLVAVNNDEDIINVYLGNGDGTFEDATAIDPAEFEEAEATGLIAVVLDDFTSPFASDEAGAPDGLLDIAALDADGVVDFYVGDGDGDFVEVVSFDLFDIAEPDDVTGAVSGTFDGGDPGLAVADADEVIFVCNDDGSFDACTTPSLIVDGGIGDPAADVVDLGLGDFDSDGNDDVVALAPNVGLVYPLFGDGAGGFEVGIALEYSSDENRRLPAAFAVGNLDGGGDDVVVFGTSSSGVDNVSLFSGTNRQVFIRSVFSSEETTTVVLGALDDNDNEDILFAQGELGIAFHPGTGSTDFSTDPGAQLVSTGGVDGRRLRGTEVIKLADLDGDSMIDVVALVADGAEIQVGLNVLGEPTFTPGPTSPVATPTQTGPTPTFTPVPPTATATPFPTVPLGRCDVDPNAASGGDEAAALRALTTGDFNADGSPDIAVADEGSVYILANSAELNSDVMSCVRDLEAGRMDPLRRSDVVTVNLEPPIRDIAAVDVDGDGNDEIAVTHAERLSVILSEPIGTSSFSYFLDERSVIIRGEPGRIAADRPNRPLDQSRRVPLDFEADGEVDLVVANGASQEVSVLRGLSGSNVFAHEPFNVGEPTRFVSAGDFDGDGSIDFAAAALTRITYIMRQGQVFTTAGGGRFDLREEIRGMDSGFVERDNRVDLFVSDTSNNTRALLSGENLSSPTNSIALNLRRRPGAVAALLFSAFDNMLDAIVAIPDTDSLLFAIGSGDGGFGAALLPLQTGDSPRAVAGADLDGDGNMDLVTANGDGTLSILISGVPPLTPTPTSTLTATETAIPTDTPTSTATNTPTPTPTNTRDPNGSPTATNTKEGIFELSGGGCAVDERGSSGAALLFLGLGVALVLRRAGQGAER